MVTTLRADYITNTINWVVLYDKPEEHQENFLEFCKEFINKSEFPNIEIEIQEFKTGGLIFNKEITKMLAISFKKSQFKYLGIYFRAQQFGKAIYFSMFETVDQNLWFMDKARTRAEIKAAIRGKCKNLAQWEEYNTLSILGVLTFWKAMEEFDPNLEKNLKVYLY